MGRNAGGRSGTLAPAASLVLLRGRESGLNGLGETMSGEIIAILAVGVALAGVILTSLKGTEDTAARGHEAAIRARGAGGA